MRAGRRGFGVRASGAVALVVAVLGGAAGSSSATLPGSNGLIALDNTVCFDDTCEDFGSRIVGVHPRSGARTRLVPCRGRECRDGSPAWAPGGRRLVVTRTEGGDWRRRVLLLVRPGATGPPRVLAHDVEGPAWSPDAGRLVVTRYRARTPRLFLMSRDGELGRRLTFRNGAGADWSSRNRIAFARVRGRGFRARQDIYSIRPNRAGLRRLTHDGCSTDPNWSPDGRRLLLRRYCRGEYGTYVMNADGTGKRLLIRRGDAAVWSPDGERIAFGRRDRLYIADADGGDVRLLWSRPGAFLSLSWQPRH